MSDVGRPVGDDHEPFSALFTPGRIAGLELKNRVLMAPMEKNLCTADGLITSRYSEYLVARARADVALLRVEATYVDPVGKGRPFQAGAHSDRIIPPLARLVAEVHAVDGRLSVELAHCGRQTSSIVTGRQPVAPSAVPCQASGGYMPRALTFGEIADIIERFAAAAARARTAGVDAIEIHGASGYLLNAFTSPYTNLRDDEYGGSPENRMRFPLEVVGAVRDVIGPDMPLIYRLSADDFVPGGITSAESGPLAAELERAGVDLIDVSAGTYESILATQPPMESEPGTLLPLAAKIKEHVSIPIATAGKLVHLEIAEQALVSGQLDFVTIGRGLHADPELLTKARSGRQDEIRRCIACAECVAFLGRGEPAYCAINPATVRERSLRTRRARIPKRVLVVGAGPAGLEAARGASLRGHSVTVFERAEQMGGQVRFGSIAAGRRDFGEPVRFLKSELSRLGVRASCGVEVDADIVAQVAPDAVIVAVGAASTPPPIPAHGAGQVLSSSDYLALEERARRDSVQPGRLDALAQATSVVVLGGNWVGCHVASLLLDRGHRVSIVEARDALAYDMGDQQGAVLRDRLVNQPGWDGAHLGCTVESIASDQVTIWRSEPSVPDEIAADAIVVVARRAPNQELAIAISRRCEASVEVFEIGDGLSPRKLQDALLDAATVAASL
jgi:2,4-dienoyl-CoA reductase-like NADH-dependent reductase (Old Yellow Enzyme family)